MDYGYPTGSDPWHDPYEPEVLDNTRPQPAPHGDFTGAARPLWQTWSYDWLGNTTETDDDEHGFYDRSLGTITNSTGTGGRYRLNSAMNLYGPGARKGAAGIVDPGYYDAAGNLRSFAVERIYNCLPANQCTAPGWFYAHYEYEWDEVGRLTRARRWDADDWQYWDWPHAELRYAYDASDMRVRKTVVDGATEQQRHTLYIFNSLEHRLVEFDGLDYDTGEQTEVPYLFVHGVRLGRVVYTGAPDFTTPSRRLYLEVGDHLGSTAIVIDRLTGELVQRDTAYPYGQVESSFRPGRWDSFREDYRFTGKEDDIEVGLIYFGARYLNPQLGRWISADPLAVHAPGKADLNLYAYVHGRVLSAVDPLGLDEAHQTSDQDFDVDVGAGSADSRYSQCSGACGGPTSAPTGSSQSMAGTAGGQLPAPQKLYDIDKHIGEPALMRVETGLLRASEDPSNSGLTQAAALTGMFALGPVAGLEQAGRGVIGAPADAYEAGQYWARASQQSDTGQKVLDTLEGIQRFAGATASWLGVASVFTNRGLAGATEAEIDAAVNAPGNSGTMIRAPAPTGARSNVSGGMMVNEHTVQSTSSAVGATGDAATKIRVHTADPTAPNGGNSATGNTVTITQGSGARRFIPGQGWVQTSKATSGQMDQSHIPIHRD